MARMCRMSLKKWLACYDSVRSWHIPRPYCSTTASVASATAPCSSSSSTIAEGRFASRRCRVTLLAAGVDSLVLVERGTSGEERIYVRSEGALQVAKYLGGAWTLARGLRIVPRFLRDLVYDGFARVRYRVFGRYDACPIPSAEQRARFID
jgi:DCC1-like thiol-disulfide oxidoreductase